MTAFAAGVYSSGSSAAAKILELYWDGELPVRPEKLAERLSIRVVGRGGYEDEDYPYSGYFQFRNGVPTIEYNVNDARVRKRFTIAHELGHFALGHERAPRDRPDSFGSKNRNPIESQANQFAAELLMPARAVRSMVMRGITSIDELAKQFSVSNVAMGHRMNNLSLNV